MDVSIIVPVYKVEEYLSRCLDSLINQTYDSYEIICVDDCSPDNCGHIIDAYQKRYPNLIHSYHNEQNKGLGLTREFALTKANGTYVMFIDSDDYVKNDYVAIYMNAVNDSPDTEMVVGGYIRDMDGRLKEHRVTNSVWSTVTYAIACAKLYKKDFITNNNLHFTNVKSGEDIYFALSCFYYGIKYKVIDYAGYYYYYNQNSITGSMTYKNNYEVIVSDIFHTFLTNYDIRFLPKEKQQIIEYVYAANMINALAIFNKGCGIKLMRKKLKFVSYDISNSFPNIWSNPYAGFLKPNGQTGKIRFGVGSVYFLHKLHLDKVAFYCLSII